TYDAETRQAIALLKGKINTKAAIEVWEAALKTTWDRPPVWIHGDVSAGNLLVKAGRLSSVIDFGMLGVGDPACDLSIAWTLFSGESREAFRAMLPLDAGTWPPGRWRRSVEWSNRSALASSDSMSVPSAALCGFLPGSKPMRTLPVRHRARPYSFVTAQKVVSWGSCLCGCRSPSSIMSMSTRSSSARE